MKVSFFTCTFNVTSFMGDTEKVSSIIAKHILIFNPRIFKSSTKLKIGEFEPLQR